MTIIGFEFNTCYHNLVPKKSSFVDFHALLRCGILCIWSLLAYSERASLAEGATVEHLWGILVGVGAVAHFWCSVMVAT
jgi:hypothetical protein